MHCFGECGTILMFESLLSNGDLMHLLALILSFLPWALISIPLPKALISIHLTWTLILNHHLLSQSQSSLQEHRLQTG